MITLKIKSYPPHFDGSLSQAEAIALVSDPLRVARHPFFPFIEYPERWKKFDGTVKSRPIKYAARRDSCIYSYYRGLLSTAYEAELDARQLRSAVLAYRRIPKQSGKGNKCNIHFAGDVFLEVAGLKNCLVYTMDISSFFESLDHSRLKQLWKGLLRFRSLPPDHFAVFRNLTQYACVDREALYRKLGFIGTKLASGKQVEGYLVKRVPMQVCSAAEFKQKVAPLITVNTSGHGIPQGSPMSDVLANLYLLDFDTAMAAEMKKVGGKYFRYSDDILLVVPGHADDIVQRQKSVETLLQNCGSHLVIQQKKTTVHRFSQGTQGLSCDRVSGTSGRNGLEYLGFRFDGTRIFIRDSTRSRLQRKMTFAVHSEVRRLIQGNPGSGRAQLKKQFNPNRVLQQFYKVRNFEAVSGIPTEWTFWTYVMRSSKAFGAAGDPIGRQFRGFKRDISYKAEKTIDKYVSAP